jgi:hypothetical protein
MKGNILEPNYYFFDDLRLVNIADIGIKWDVFAFFLRFRAEKADMKNIFRNILFLS